MGDTSYALEEFALFNPAYVGFLLYSSIREFEEIGKCGMHCALPYIVLPMALNPTVNSVLPRSYKTPLSSWVSSNEGVLSDFHYHARALLKTVSSSVNILLRHNLLTIIPDGAYLTGPKSAPRLPAIFKSSQHMDQSLKASKLLGKWFARSLPTESIFVQLGVRP